MGWLFGKKRRHHRKKSILGGGGGGNTALLVLFGLGALYIVAKEPNFIKNLMPSSPAKAKYASYESTVDPDTIALDTNENDGPGTYTGYSSDAGIPEDEVGEYDVAEPYDYNAYEAIIDSE
jgi:hypothetical protein